MKYAYFGRLKNQRHKGVICFGYVVDSVANEIQYSTAFCSPKDNFNKKIAHSILEGRHKKGHYVTVFDVKVPEMLGKEILRTIVDYYNKLGGDWLFGRRCPNWASKIPVKLYDVTVR